MRWLTPLVLFWSMSACAMAPRMAIDPVTRSTILDGDATAIVEGCGSQPFVGGTFCRQEEGEVAGKTISFIAPPAQCNKEACAFVKVYNNEGRLVWGGSFPKGATRLTVAWRTLLERDTFEVSSRGFWTYSLTVYWLGPDGNERESTALGDIVLRVFRAGYIPLHNVEMDPAFVWSWTDSGFLYRMTSGLRAFVKKL